ncbi:MAG: hypothetical protein V1750_02520, partial [Acidobacteriota bacterium]
MTTNTMAGRALVAAACVSTAFLGALALVRAQESRSPDVGLAGARQPAIGHAPPGLPERALPLVSRTGPGEETAAGRGEVSSTGRPVQPKLSASATCTDFYGTCVSLIKLFG